MSLREGMMAVNRKQSGIMPARAGKEIKEIAPLE